MILKQRKKFYELLQKNNHQLSESMLSIKERDISAFQPWQNIVSNKRLDWWYDYTQIKHNRMGKEGHDRNYEKANLKNTLYALGALFIIENELYMTLQEKQTGAIDGKPCPLYPFSKLFKYNKIDNNFCDLGDCFCENINS